MRPTVTPETRMLRLSVLSRHGTLGTRPPRCPVLRVDPLGAGGNSSGWGGKVVPGRHKQRPCTIVADLHIRAERRSVCGENRNGIIADAQAGRRAFACRQK